MIYEKTFLQHIFTLNAGGGHYATLRALSAIADQQKPILQWYCDRIVWRSHNIKEGDNNA